MSGHEQTGVPLSDMLAAPTTLVVRGVELQINVLPLERWAPIERWFRTEIMRSSLAAIDAVPFALRDAVVREVVRAAQGVSIADRVTLNGLLRSIGGMFRVATLSLAVGGNEHLIADSGSGRRRRSRGLTEHDLSAFVGQDIEALASIVAEVVQISLVVDDADEDDNEQEIPPDPPADEGGAADQSDEAAPTA